MAQHRTRRWAALFLSAALTLSQIAPVAYAQAPGTGLCEHHPQHTDECGYTEGSEGTPCNHAHTEDCYTLVTNCVHEHTNECYPAESVSGNTATPSEAEEAEPTECTHVCSEESGCITKVLDCKHEHDEACGYTPATEGTPCTYVCEICNPQDSGEAEDAGTEEEPATPSNAIDSAVTDVQALIDALPTAEELERMSQDEQGTVYEQVQAAYDAYNALTDEQKGQITGVEVFNDLFDVFNSMAAPAAELPGTQIDLSTLDSTYTISDSNTYSFTGSGSYGITVTSGSPTIVLSNATINVSSGNAVSITGGGTATIKVEGNCTVQNMNRVDGGAGVYVAQDSTVRITSDDRSSTLTARANGDAAGIGGYYDGNYHACGNITITNVTVYAYGSDYSFCSPGIGAVGTTSCGTITIDYATIYAYGTGIPNVCAAPAIGGGLSMSGSCGPVPKIVILHDSEIHAHSGGSYAQYIGSAGFMSSPSGDIALGGGSATDSVVYMYTGSSTTPDKTQEYTGSGETAYPVEITAAGATPSSVTVGYTTGPTLSVTATTTLSDTLTYQWYKDSVSYANQIDGATSASYQVPPGLAVGTYTYKCVVSCGGYTLASDSITFTVEDVTQLATPGGLSWDSDNPGRATWNAVTNASGYSVQIYKDGTAQGSPVTASGTSHDFMITDAGSYTFTVTAKGSGSYSDSSASSPSAALYTVSFDTMGGTGTFSMQLVPNGGKVTKPTTAPTNTGHDFVGWYKDSGLNTAWDFENDTVTTTTTLYAKWTALQYEVTLNTNGGTINSGNVTEYTYGVGATLPTAENMTYTGHDFEGWYENSDFSGSAVTAISTTDTGAKTYYAKWEASTYDVTLEANGGTINSGNVTEYTYGQGATLPTADDMTYIGHDFGGWYDNQELTGSPITAISTTDTGEKTYYAKWTLIDYAITVTVAGGTGNSASASVNSTTVTSANMGDTVTLTATPAEDYHFVEWQVTSGGVTISEQNTFTMPAEAVAITAVFEEHTFTGWTANGNDTHTGTCSCGETSTEACTYENGVCTVCGYVDVTTTDPANSTVKEGETATFTVTATGNGISYQWQISTDGSAWADIDRANSSSYTTQAATMDMNGYQYRCVVSNTTRDSATSSAATLTVNKTPSTIDPAFIGYFVEHYQKDPASGKYELYEREYFVDEINAEVTATPKNYTGYAYNSAAAGTVTSGTLTKIEDEADIVTLKLYYDPESYSVTLNTNGGTITSGDVTEYTYGIGAALPTAEDMTYNGYVFKGWYENSDFSGEAVTAISATDTGDKTYYAQWTRLYTVTVTAESGGTVSGGGTFEDGSIVTVTATANSGYHFVEWRENNVKVSGDAAYTFTLTADRSLTAVFNRDSSGGGGGGTSYDYYTISATAGEGGSISPSGSISVREGRDQTYTITPDGGYRISDVRVDGVSVGAVSSYTFDNVQKRHTIEAIFAKENPDTGNPFTDVHPDDWFYNDVMFVYQNGLMAGTSDTTFSPNAPITRAQVAVIFYRMAGSPAVTGDSPFTDVENGPGTAWYYNAVLWAQQNGIVSGYGDGTFHPGTNITREQLAVIFYNYAKLKGYDVSAVNDLSSFTDAGDVSDWALPAMRWAVGSGIMGGYGDGILGPQGTATRAQVAAMLRRFIENNKLVPPAVLPGGDSGTTGTGSGGWTQQVTSPQTGDSSNVGLWFSLMLLSLSGIAALLITEKVRRHRMEDEEAPDPLAI